MLMFAPVSTAKADIIPDWTLEQASTVPSDCRVCIISGGTTRGEYLFHSFKDFSLNRNEVALFGASDDINTIVSRVTGDRSSRIDGAIQANTTLFFINPQGIVFGPNASLNISNGSFLATTADYLEFDTGQGEFQFSANNPEDVPLLTINAPIGLGFGNAPGSIRHHPDSRLSLPANETLTIIGNGIRLNEATIKSESGRIELGSVAANSRVGLEAVIVNSSPAGETNPQNNRTTANAIASGWTIDYSAVNTFSPIDLTNGSQLNVAGNEGGEIQLQGSQIRIAKESIVRSETTEQGSSGRIRLQASDSIHLNRSGSVRVLVREEARGNGGQLTIAAPRLTIRNGADLSTSVLGRGRGANLRVRVRDRILLQGILKPDGHQEPEPTGIFAQMAENSIRGRGGTIDIQTNNLMVQDGAQITASTFSRGSAGSIMLRIFDTLHMVGASFSTGDVPSGILSQVEEGFNATGDAGNIQIDTKRLVLLDGAQISSAARNSGNGRHVTIQATESILLRGTSPNATAIGGSSGIFVSAEPEYIDEQSQEPILSTGRSGNLIINTQHLTVEQGAKLAANTFGTDRGGNLTITANQIMIQDGGTVRAGSLVGPPVEANDNTAIPDRLASSLVEASDNTAIPARGQGGRLTINATERITVSGEGQIGMLPDLISSTILAEAQGSGNAGDIIINTPLLSVMEGANVTVSGRKSQAGTLTIDADIITLDGGQLEARTARLGRAEGAIINLIPSSILLLQNESQISAQASNNANGGNINIDASQGFVMTTAAANSDIEAIANEGNGGRVEIETLGLFGLEERDRLTPLSDITVSSSFGLAGEIVLRTPNLDPSQGTVQLPNSLVDASRLLARNLCELSSASSFIAVGRGGLPPTPSELFTGDDLWQDHRLVYVDETMGRVANSSNTIGAIPNNAPNNNSEAIANQIPNIEAQGWMKNASGSIVLVGHSRGSTPGISATTCTPVNRL